MSGNPRIYSAVTTVLIAAIVVLWMISDSVSLSGKDKKWPPKHDSEIVIDDEYAELIDLPMPKTPRLTDPMAAKKDEPADNNAEAAPETGMETVDKGEPGEAPEPVVQSKPSTVKVEKKKKEKQKAAPSSKLLPPSAKVLAGDASRRGLSKPNFKFKGKLSENHLQVQCCLSSST